MQQILRPSGIGSYTNPVDVLVRIPEIVNNICAYKRAIAELEVQKTQVVEQAKLAHNYIDSQLELKLTELENRQNLFKTGIATLEKSCDFTPTEDTYKKAIDVLVRTICNPKKGPNTDNLFELLDKFRSDLANLQEKKTHHFDSMLAYIQAESENMSTDPISLLPPNRSTK